MVVRRGETEPTNQQEQTMTITEIQSALHEAIHLSEYLGEHGTHRDLEDYQESLEDIARLNELLNDIEN